MKALLLGSSQQTREKTKPANPVMVAGSRVYEQGHLCSGPASRGLAWILPNKETGILQKLLCCVLWYLFRSSLLLLERAVFPVVAIRRWFKRPVYHA